MKTLGIIPARYASTRFPGKPLAMISGKSMIRRVYEQALKTAGIEKVIIATDDERIIKHVSAFGGNVMLTSPLHRSGTERCRETLLKMEESGKAHFDFVVNIQGDEPFIKPEQIASVVGLLENGAGIATLIKKITSLEELLNPNVVKVVIDSGFEALYFSRAVIPFQRGVTEGDLLRNHTYYKHIGIYGYRADILKKICDLKETPLESAESLEQLRWMENTYRIRTALTDTENIAIDTPEDLLKITNTP